MGKLRSESTVGKLVEFITFINLPIRSKFLVFSLGVLFWLLILFIISVSTLVVIRWKSNTIVHELIPRDKTAHKIMQNLQSVSIDVHDIRATSDSGLVIKRAESSDAKIHDIRLFLEVLSSGGQVQDYDRESNSVRESYAVVPMNGDPDGTLYLTGIIPIVDAIDRKLDQVIRSRSAASTVSTDRVQLETGIKELNVLLSQALNLSREYSIKVAAAYAKNSRDIGFDFTCTFVTVIVVLIVAVFLLALFTFWLSKSITVPITSIISQIRSLKEGDISSLKKIEITSKDEIGKLTGEFNGLMESISKLNAFKKLIEEDDSLEDVYLRLADKFRSDLGMQEVTIYEVANSQNKMRRVYPFEVLTLGLPCNSDILNDCHLCRAKKTGHDISSFSQPGICKSFLTSNNKEYVCLPLIMGGVTGGVVQFMFDAVDGAAWNGLQSRLFKAKQYITESVSVIDAKRLMSTLKDSALKDSLTGLYNRRFLQEYTENLVAGVLRREKQVGLIMCDLDYFKQVNDVYGHNTGDELLKATSVIIKNSIRASDFVIRFGGEEFLVVLIDILPEESFAVAEKIRESVQAAKLKVPDGVIQKTISLGISEFPTDTDSFWQALKYADVALYKAKESGRNRSLRFTRDMWDGDQF